MDNGRVYEDVSPEELKLCMSCPKPECDNCLGAPTAGRAARVERNRKKAEALYLQGVSTQDIATVLGVHHATISGYLRSMGYKLKPGRRVK